MPTTQRDDAVVSEQQDSPRAEGAEQDATKGSQGSEKPSQNEAIPERKEPIEICVRPRKHDRNQLQKSWSMRRGDQRSIGVIVAIALVCLSVHVVYLVARPGGSVDIERAGRLSVDFRIDLNRASWPELTLLPGIGENLAKRIVRSREDDGAFTSIDQVQRVRGIGPKKTEQIRPYLLSIDNTAKPKIDRSVE